MRRKRSAIVLLVIATIVVPLAGCAPSNPPSLINPTPSINSLYVSPSGHDGYPGTKTAPFLTLDKASSVATPGTTVYVADGTYTGSFTTKANGRADARIAYVAETRWGAKLVGDEDKPAVWRNEGDYVDMVGFEISGSNVDGLVEAGSYGRIVGIKAHGFEDSCIATANDDYSMHDIDVIGNVTFGCGTDHLDHGIYVSHPRGNVSNNISYGNPGYGIHCWHNCNELVVANNLVFDNKQGGIVIGQGDNPNNGKVDANGFIVSNNIAINNVRYGINESGATGPDNQYLNNNVFGNEKDGILLKTGTESGTMSIDPMFVMSQPNEQEDCRVQPSSSVLNAGTPVGAPPTDINGTPRPQGDPPDLGPCEHP